MITIATNQDNDIYVNASGNLATSNEISALANISKNVILTNKGEPQYNQQDGIPYFETIFTDTPLIDLFQAAQISRLKQIEGVQRVSNYEYKYGKNIYSYTLTEDTIYGDIQING